MTNFPLHTVRWPAALAAVVGAATVFLTAPVGDAGGVAIAQEQAVIRLNPVRDAAGISFVHQFGAGGDHIVESGGSGAAWIDYDIDGDLDVVMVNGLPQRDGDPAAGSGHALFRNLGASFFEAPPQSGIGDRVWGAGATVADVDNDGFPDLLVTAAGADRLYRNNGDGTFSVWPVGLEDEGWSTSASFTDSTLR